jgi:hypothetical protein
LISDGFNTLAEYVQLKKVFLGNTFAKCVSRGTKNVTKYSVNDILYLQQNVDITALNTGKFVQCWTKGDTKTCAFLKLYLIGIEQE